MCLNIRYFYIVTGRAGWEDGEVEIQCDVCGLWCEKVGSSVGTGRLITEEGREEGGGREGEGEIGGGEGGATGGY